MSDFLFCAVTIINRYLFEEKVMYASKDVSMMARVYGPYFQELFFKTSTYVTVLMTLYRHIAVSRPISAKQYLTVINTAISIVICITFWILFLLPLLWTWNIETIACPNGNVIYLLGDGNFEENIVLRQIFIHAWSVVGFMIPVIILGYCNIKLIISLRTSMSMKSAGTGAQSQRQKQRLAAQRTMNITLIAVVASFFLLVFPSELFHYILEFGKEGQSKSAVSKAVVTCNLFLALNMSINVVLYCVVNSNFRRTLKKMLPSCLWRRRNKTDAEYSVTNATDRTVAATEIIPLENSPEEDAENMAMENNTPD